MSALFLAALALVTAAPDDASARTAAILYAAPSDCPGASTFFSLLEERTAGTWRVRAGHGGLVVEIRDGAQEKIGSVRRIGGTDEGVREITGTDCGELVRALVLSAALSLDEGSATAKLMTPAGRGSVSPVSPSSPPRTAGSSWLVGGGALTTFLLPSQPMPQGSLFIERGRPPGRRGLGIGVPDLRLSASYARNDLFGSQRARFALASAALAVCPAGVGFTETVALRFCVAGEVGLFFGEGVAITRPATSRFLWAAGGGALHLRWAPSSRLIVEAQVGVSTPLERTTFVFEMPRVEVARVPAWVASGGIMAGFTIP
jgi:hypothetical protein